MFSITIVSRYEKDKESIIRALTEQKDFIIASTGENGYQAIKSAKTQHPDIIIMDFNMNDINSFDLVHIIKHHSPSTELIILYSPCESDSLNYAFQAGASGCFQRQEEFFDIVSSVRSVLYGGMYFGGLTRDNSLRCFSLNTAPKKEIFSYNFSNTELCIFNGITHGFSDREIAKDLNMTEGSLRNCINKTKHKTGLNNRTQICLYATYAGKINPQKIREQFLNKP